MTTPPPTDKEIVARPGRDIVRRYIAKGCRFLVGKNAYAEEMALEIERALGAARAEAERETVERFQADCDAMRKTIEELETANYENLKHTNDLRQQLAEHDLPHAGCVLKNVAKFAATNHSFSRAEVAAHLSSSATAKEVSNALGYLVRVQKLRRPGYGQYVSALSPPEPQPKEST